MIKKILIIMLAASLFIISCGTSIRGNKPEGWVNNDIFRVMGKGSPSKGISDKFEREVNARLAAELDGKNKIVAKIVGPYIEALNSTEKDMIDENVMQERVAERVIGLSVIESKWDFQQNCTVVMELYGKGLKNKMDNLVSEYLNEVGMQYTAEDISRMVN
ncbi:hypothetical protein [Brachyspira alvinipulli]|uniref:hypothetical protein n=1 Tax=Brachyspira alvinipulli TaxID=84379 RepID=UPI0004B801C9|nr:hypothetical protein [Brachyspira alvinipulli]